MRKAQVTIIHNTIAPYRHPFFEKLSKEVNLMIYYCSVKYRSREWELWPKDYYYKYKVLEVLPIRTPIGDSSLNPFIVKEIIKSPPHVVILNGYTDLTIWLVFIIAKLMKIPQIYWTEGVKEPLSIFGLLTRPLRILLARKVDAIVVPGHLSKNCVVSQGADPEKVFIAPNAIDNSLFTETFSKYNECRSQLRARLGFAKDKITILYVGRLCEQKGLIFLVKAFKRLKSKNKNLALIIVGYGELYDKLQKMCSELEIEDDVKLTGLVTDYEELVKYYSVSDIFVLPTLGDVWGFVINEAMVCSLPIIATRASQAAQEMVQIGRNGYVIKEADEDELFEALWKLISDSELRANMGAESKLTVLSEFNIDCMVKGFLNAITSVSND